LAPWFIFFSVSLYLASRSVFLASSFSISSRMRARSSLLLPSGALAGTAGAVAAGGEGSFFSASSYHGCDDDDGG
jgi:hypothetical protein